MMVLGGSGGSSYGPDSSQAAVVGNDHHGGCLRDRDAEPKSRPERALHITLPFMRFGSVNRPRRSKGLNCDAIQKPDRR